LPRIGRKNIRFVGKKGEKSAKVLLALGGERKSARAVSAMLSDKKDAA